MATNVRDFITPVRAAGFVARNATTTGIRVINKTGSSIAANKLVAVTGLDTTTKLVKVVLADADVAAHDDFYVTKAAIADGAQGYVYKGFLSPATLDTSGVATVGDPVYLSATAGAFTATAPSAGDAVLQPVGFATVKSSTVGQLYWRIPTMMRKIGTNQLQASMTLTTPTLTAPVISGAGSITGLINSDLKVLAASFTANSGGTGSTLTSLTGFSWTLVAGATYRFMVKVPTVTMTTNGGLKMAFKLTTATITSINARVQQSTDTDNTGAISTSFVTTTDQSTWFDQKTVAYTWAMVEGTLVVGTGGTIAVQAAQNTSHADTTTILAGAFASFNRTS